MSAGIRHDDLRTRNRAMVIGAVRRSAQPSRTEIAATTGLSHSTISAISSDLIAEGILVQVKPGGSAVALKRGRPQVALDLAPGAASILTVELSLNVLSAAVVDYAGGIVVDEQRKLRTLSLSEADLIAECVDMIGRLLLGCGPQGKRPSRIVLAVQGITDTHGRTMLWSPITPHGDIRFSDVLEREFAIPVAVENDCNMMAVALRWRNPDRYRDNFIAILLSHGIGMGMVLKGELFTGTHSSGGEFGHMIHVPGGALCRCGRRGCVEAYAGNYAIWRNARGNAETDAPVANISDADIVELADRARAGDAAARAAFARAGEAIGFGLGSLFALIDPAPVAFVGVGASAFDLMEEAIGAALSETAGGQHSGAISFAVEPDELPLIRSGCAVRALTHIDREVFAPGIQPAAVGPGRCVA
jgi:predicted NBD/HSP70 family sugar kinase